MVFADRILAPLAKLRSKLHQPQSSMAQDGVLHPALALRKRPPRKRVPTATETALTIPCPDPTAEERERDRHHALGLQLARQEDWQTLSDLITQAEQAASKTTGGMSVAELLAFGARADVVGAVEHALLNGLPERGAPLMVGIEALEEVLEEFSSDPVIASIVAKAHMDIGWAWRGTAWGIDVPAHNQDVLQAHFERAAEIVAAVPDSDHKSILFASTKCALHGGIDSPVHKVVADYESWIDLDPTNTQALRALGSHLLPRWRGSYDRLELEARRTAARTYDIWGAGAYAWVMFDAISTDAEACARVDIDYFLDGLRDILTRCPDQYTVNLLVAYCATTMGATSAGHVEADQTRTQIAKAAAWMVKSHLTELHPMLWAHAARGFDNALKVRCPERFAASGHADALRFLNDLFRSELADGQQVDFTTSGIVMRSGEQWPA